MGTRHVSIGAATAQGEGGIGVTEVSCGFEEESGGISVSNFVLNIQTKVRSSNVNVPTDSRYESWYPGANCLYNNCRGLFRSTMLKFSMRNISVRGAYFWKPAGQVCKENGQAAVSPQECCSFASNGTSCVACLASGTSASAPTACCSGVISGGACQ
jgi:hypothetical protein